MISFEMSISLRWMYSGRLSGVIKEKFEMSIVMNCAPYVDITILNTSLATIMLAVGVATFPG